MKRRKLAMTHGADAKPHSANDNLDVKSAEGVVSTELATQQHHAAQRDRFAWCRALGAAVLLWAAFPPLGWWGLAWIAPLGWLCFIQPARLSIRRPYRMLYVAGLLHWMLLIQWIRLPHWSAYMGWFALAAYLAAYVPLFVAGSRFLLHRCHLPLVVSAPVVWTGLEWFRGHFLTGFSISLLGHTQLPFDSLVQIADLVGAYGVSFMVIQVAAALLHVLLAVRSWLAAKGTVDNSTQRLLIEVISVAILFGFACRYGVDRQAELRAVVMADKPLRVALIQGAFDTKFDGDFERIQDAFFDYATLARQAAVGHPDLDVMIWPESMFTATEAMVSYSEPVVPVARWDGTGAELRTRLDEIRESVEARFAWVTRQTETPMIVGIEWDHFQDGRTLRHNSAVYVSTDAEVLGRYDKMHPVMFGEYVPLGDWLPWLYALTPMGNGIEAGRAPQVFAVGDVQLAPTICFENTVPHLMRRQLLQLSRVGETCDVLTTITNDGWFWGSSLLDAHLACGVFRAIELRRPLLIAANTGFSAVIDHAGRVQSQGPRRQAAIVYGEVRIPVQPVVSGYLRYGDLFAASCFALTILGVAVGMSRSLNTTANARS